MLRLAMTPTAECHERAHDSNNTSKPNDGFATDVNPLIRQLLLARDTMKDTPQWQHA